MMSIQEKIGYVNPLSMLGNKQDKAQELQNKRQQLQNEMLLRKAMSAETGGMPVEEEKAMEKRLEELSQELRAEKGNVDVYEKEENITKEAGIYQLNREAGNQREVAFVSYDRTFGGQGQ